jgi:hypothetical protein
VERTWFLVAFQSPDSKKMSAIIRASSGRSEAAMKLNEYSDGTSMRELEANVAAESIEVRGRLFVTVEDSFSVAVGLRAGRSDRLSQTLFVL